MKSRRTDFGLLQLFNQNSIVFFLVFFLGFLPLISSSTASTTGIIIPLYTYPGNTWESVISIKTNFPEVPILAIINPNSGPGETKDTNYESGIKDMRDAGIKVIGYTWTNFTIRDIADVYSDIDQYKKWYDQDGVFLDEMSNIAGNEKYYSNITSYANIQNFPYSVGNPGTSTLPSYIDTVDNIIIYERAGIANIFSFDEWISIYPKENFSVLSYDVPTLDNDFVLEATNHVGYLYLTNDILSNPWDSLPPYLKDMVSVLDSMGSAAQRPTGLDVGTANIPLDSSIVDVVNPWLN